MNHIFNIALKRFKFSSYLTDKRRCEFEEDQMAVQFDNLKEALDAVEELKEKMTRSGFYGTSNRVLTIETNDIDADGGYFYKTVFQSEVF